MTADPGAFVVCGSRAWPREELWFVTAKMVELIPAGATVITGGARGVDRHAHDEAVRLGHPTRVYEPDWKTYGKRAGFVRNAEMLMDGAPVAVLAFQWGGSRGTAHTARLARQLGIPCHWFTEVDLIPTLDLQ